jgi:hypothetical protein
MALESSPVAKAIIDFVHEVGEWSGTMTDLLEELEQRADLKTKSLKTWPKSSSPLGSAVKRLAPNLRKTGISVQEHKLGKKRKPMLALALQQEQACETPSAVSAPSADANSSRFYESDADGADGGASLADDPPSGAAAEFVEVMVQADRADTADGELRLRSDVDSLTSARPWTSLCSGRIAPDALMHPRNDEVVS